MHQAWSARLQGLRMSGFLEARVEPGQRSIAAFMGQAGRRGGQQQGSAAAAEEQLELAVDEDTGAAGLHLEDAAPEEAAGAVPQQAYPHHLVRAH